MRTCVHACVYVFPSERALRTLCALHASVHGVRAIVLRCARGFVCARLCVRAYMCLNMNAHICTDMRIDMCIDILLTRVLTYVSRHEQYAYSCIDAGAATASDATAKAGAAAEAAAEAAT